jgi:tetratricopeptide (TPR) repeat protein
MSKHNENVKAMGLVFSNLQDGAYFYNKGIEAYREKNLLKAKQYLERAISLDPKEQAFQCQLAIVHADLGDFHSSNDCLIKIVADNSGEEMPEAHFFLANNYANLGLFEHARKEALIYIDKDPEGEFLEDIEDLLELLQEEEDDLFAEAETFLIRYELASHELKKQNYDKAISYFMDLLKERPEYWMAHIRLAEAYYLEGNSEKAIEILRSVLDKEDNVLARSHLMNYYFETGEIEKAETIAQALANVWSIDFDQSYSLAISFGKVGEHEHAYHRLDRLHRKGYGDFPKFSYHLAVANFYTGRVEKAVAIWEKLATIGNGAASNHLQLLQNGNEIEPTYNFGEN